MKNFSEQKLGVCAWKWKRTIHSFERLIPKHWDTTNSSPALESTLEAMQCMKCDRLPTSQQWGVLNITVERLASLSSAGWLYSCRSALVNQKNGRLWVNVQRCCVTNWWNTVTKHKLFDLNGKIRLKENPDCIQQSMLRFLAMLAEMLNVCDYACLSMSIDVNFHGYTL